MVIKREVSFVWTPKVTTRLIWSIKIAGVEYKTRVFEVKMKRKVTKGASSADIEIRNLNGEYNNVINREDIVQVYADYSDGSTKIFEGTVDSISYEWEKHSSIIVKAVDYGAKALKKIVNKQYTTATAISTIFTELVSEYLPSYTTTNVATISTTAQPTWVDKPLWQCFKDLMELTESNYDFYCDFDKDWHVFEKGANYNTSEALFYGRNLEKIAKTPYNDSDIYDKVTVIGKNVENIPLMYTVGTGEKEKVIRDTNLSTLDEVAERANRIYVVMSNPGETGTFKASGMVNLNPGDMIFIFAPYQNTQDNYIINEFEHNLKGNSLRTNGNFQEKEKTLDDISSLLADNLEQEQETRDVDNPAGMKYSWVLTFADTGFVETFTDTEISGGYLQVETGDSSGTMESVSYTAPGNATYVYLKVTGDGLTGTTYEVSTDNGYSYQEIQPQTNTALNSPGQYLKLKVTLKSTSTKIKALGLMYKI